MPFSFITVNEVKEGLGWLEALLRLVEALAWPITVFIIVLIFRKPLTELIKLLEEFEFGPVKGKVRRLNEEAAKIQGTVVGSRSSSGRSGEESKPAEQAKPEDRPPEADMGSRPSNAPEPNQQTDPVNQSEHSPERSYTPLPEENPVQDTSSGTPNPWDTFKDFIQIMASTSPEGIILQKWRQVDAKLRTVAGQYGFTTKEADPTIAVSPFIPARQIAHYLFESALIDRQLYESVVFLNKTRNFVAHNSLDKEGIEIELATRYVEIANVLLKRLDEIDSNR